MKKLAKILKITSITLFMLVLFTSTIGVGYYFSVTNSISLNTEKIENSKTASAMKIYDINHEEIKASNDSYISLKKLSSHTKNAFICAEDKRFFSHKGLDYIRIGGAILSNIKSRSFSQGASTISQQLIKNTHLSNEKTLNRKLKEIKLTKDLEKQYNKNEILEMYLNNIYFGNGCYGIENASNHYFGKSASKLTIAESALLAGTINAPSYYDIENKPEIAQKRRDLILQLMKNYGKITESEKLTAIKEPINLNITKLSSNNYIYDEIIKEACKHLKKSENLLKNSNVKIYTEIDLSLQKQINSTLKKSYSNIESKPNTATIVINNKTGKIVSITGTKSTLSSNKQPGSTIKPILVYAPAIEYGYISPATKILDEKTNFNGYSPENADKKYHGFVSVREALKNSYNIPAVKTLNETGISKSQEFAKRIGITFTENDNNLATALGGFTNGLSLKTLCDAYSSFASGGSFTPSSYITKITSDGKVIYTSNLKKQQAMSSSTAYLITDMLLDTSTSGTAKRLKDLNFEVASKTGTVGKNGSKSNTDAFNVAYTSNHTILSYVGGTTMPESINGATYPTMISKDILNLLYKNNPPKDFNKPTSIITKLIDKDEYSKNIISETDDTSNSISEIFSKTNLPSQTKSSLNLKLDVFNFEDKKPLLCFFVSPNYSYQIIRKNKNKEETISSLQNIKNAKIIKFEDISAKKDEIYDYFVRITKNSTNEIFTTNNCKLKSF